MLDYHSGGFMAICGVKFRAYPTKEQQKILSEWIGCARVIYNCKVAQDQRNYQEYKQTGVKSPVDQAYSHFKTPDKEWLKNCPSQILRNSSSNWYVAKQRFFKGLAKNPRKKKKGDRDTVLLTNELFSFKDKVNSDGVISKALYIGTKTHPVGILNFTAHKEFGNPQQIVIGKKNGQWSVSFCYETEQELKTEQELLSHYSLYDEKSLTEVTVGIDRGVAIPFKTNKESQFDFDNNTKKSLSKKHLKLKKHQKRLHRQKNGSNSRNKTKRKIGKLHQKMASIRHDFCHKVSNELALSSSKIFAVEDLKLKNMTKARKPKIDENGNYLPNKRAAKAGLNRELLSKGLAKTIDFLEYKAKKYGKLVVKVSPQYSSQECANCGHTHQDNRKTQAEFVCLSCGNHDNADNNAAKVIAKRGVQFLLSKPKAATRTRLGTSRSKVGRGICKTKLEKSDSQIPMTPEALAL